jgi:hypothetical protein
MKYLILLIIMCSMVTAIDVSMKTNDVYTADFEFENIDDGDELRDCIPYFTQDLVKKSFVTIEPQQFNLNSGESQIVQIKIINPETGYYRDELNVRCARYVNGEFIGAGDIFESGKEINVIVALAGEGQSYYISPTNEYFFLAKPGQDESAEFQIANLGSVDLDVSFQIRPGITITPVRRTIDIGEVESFRIDVQIPEDFTSLDTEIPVLIGDFGDTIKISGEVESLSTGAGGAVANIALGNVQVQDVAIPAWVILVVTGGSFWLLFREFQRRK